MNREKLRMKYYAKLINECTFCVCSVVFMAATVLSASLAALATSMGMTFYFLFLGCYYHIQVKKIWKQLWEVD